MDPHLVTLPSPLLGPSAWDPVAEALRRLGRRVTTVHAAGRTSPTAVLEAFAAALPEGGAAVLVPHSNAGLYVPALSARHQIAGVVFVDAALDDDAEQVHLAPPGLLAHLRGLADPSGLLPPWTGWWDPAAVAGLFGDDATRARVEREQPRLPLSYLESRLPGSPGWHERLPAAYVAFGDTYAEELATARSRGWPTTTIAGRHLHLLVDPGAVAGAVSAMLTRLGLDE